MSKHSGAGASRRRQREHSSSEIRRTAQASAITIKLRPSERRRGSGELSRARAEPALVASERLRTRSELLSVVLTLLDVSGQPIQDPDAILTFRRLQDKRQIGKQVTGPIPPRPVRFQIPVQTNVPVLCELELKRYRVAHSPVFFATPGPPICRQVQLFRDPDDWAATFTAWRSLSPFFGDLTRVLAHSPEISFRGEMRPRDRRRDQDKRVGTMTGAAYDGFGSGGPGDHPEARAKATLLNIYYRLLTASDPIANVPWFSYVREILTIERERVVAVADPKMEESVRYIHDNIDHFRRDYEHSPIGDHRKNVPAHMQDRIERIVTIKSTHEKANYQLTVLRLNRPDQVLVDADIDENGTLLKHFWDSQVTHKRTGGTHPFDIHELLWISDGRHRSIDLGYTLV